jgi:hypothetical protein
MTDYYNYLLFSRLLHSVRNDGAPFIVWGEEQAAGYICFLSLKMMIRRLLFTLSSCLISVIATAKREAICCLT